MPPPEIFRSSYGPVHYELLTNEELSVIKFAVQSSKLQKKLSNICAFKNIEVI